MNEKIIFVAVLASSFFQILHIFEEIHLKAYKIIKGEHAQGIYFRDNSLIFSGKAFCR